VAKPQDRAQRPASVTRFPPTDEPVILVRAGRRWRRQEFDRRQNGSQSGLDYFNPNEGCETNLAVDRLFSGRGQLAGLEEAGLEAHQWAFQPHL
jgi:hypothetical protein